VVLDPKFGAAAGTRTSSLQFLGCGKILETERRVVDRGIHTLAPASMANFSGNLSAGEAVDPPHRRTAGVADPPIIEPQR
jgi:hypothetical protein